MDLSVDGVNGHRLNHPCASSSGNPMPTVTRSLSRRSRPGIVDMTSSAGFDKKPKATSLTPARRLKIEQVRLIMESVGPSDKPFIAVEAPSEGSRVPQGPRSSTTATQSRCARVSLLRAIACKVLRSCPAQHIACDIRVCIARRSALALPSITELTCVLRCRVRTLTLPMRRPHNPSANTLWHMTRA